MARFFKSAQEGKSAGIDIPVELVERLARYNDDYAIFIGAKFGRQADIIIFSKQAAHVIEVKDKRGTIAITEDGNWLLDDGTVIFNEWGKEKETPIVQAKRTARALESFLQKVFRERNKEFRGRVFPYILIPYATPETCSNLFSLKEIEKWVWVITSLQDLPNSVAKRDEYAKERTDFAFSPEDIQYIARKLYLVPTDEIVGIQITPNPQRPTSDTHETRMTETSVRKRIPQPSKVVRTTSQKHRTVWPLWLIITAIILLCCLEAGLVATFFTDLKNLGSIFLMPVTPTASWIASPTSPLSQNLPPEASPTSPRATSPSFTPTASPNPSPSSTPIPTLPPSPTLTTFVGEWSVKKNGLILTVEKVEIFDNRFRIWMRATNRTSDVLTLPLFKNFFVVDNLGNQYEADIYSSTFPRDVAPGATISGYAEIKGHLDGSATSIKVLFSHVYGSFLSGPVAIEGIPVR